MSDSEDHVSPIQAAPFGWLVRPCENYWEEHTQCKTINSRFYQYYIDGKFADCSHWKERAKLCDKWDNHKDKKALVTLIEMEKKRYTERIAPNIGNDVWERRKEPPKDWNKTLPESHEKRIEESYLKKLVESKIEPPSFCVIL